MGLAEYEEVAISNAKMLGDRILCKWEVATEKYGNTELIRPDQFRQAHYTGLVLKVGPQVSIDLKEGDRIAFDRWSEGGSFTKLSDPEHGRVCIISEIAQEDCLCIIPQRGHITLKEVRPIGARVLVKPNVKDWTEKHGIYFPGDKALDVQHGEVIAVGQSEAIEVEPGQLVVYQKYAGAEIPIEGQDYLLLLNSKILGVMESMAVAE